MKYTSECVLSSTDDCLYHEKHYLFRSRKYKAVIGLSELCDTRLLAVGSTECSACNSFSLKCKAVIIG